MIDFWELNLIEQNWEQSQKKIQDFELLNIFPEAREVIKRQAKEKLARFEHLKILIADSLRNIKESVDDTFTKFFRKEIIRTWFGTEYESLSRELKKMFWLLKKSKKVEDKRITNYDIARARMHSVEEFIPLVRGDFALCPFVKEKHPSFHVFGENKEKYYCFAHNEKGDVIDLVQKLRGLNFIDSVKLLSN